MSGRQTGVRQLDVVTGAFGYSGAAIARDLRAADRRTHPGVVIDDQHPNPAMRDRRRTDPYKLAAIRRRANSPGRQDSP
jgi:nucleoside-diphosphate-sugar epimerase